jgi:class 3 adenylate cyclase
LKNIFHLPICFQEIAQALSREDRSNDEEEGGEEVHGVYQMRAIAKDHGARASLEGERKVVTVLFADVAGFTSLSEKLDPEEVHQIMEGCFQILMDEIHRYEGTIDKFTGDGVMALFGAPIAHEDAPQRALYTALGMSDRLREYALKLQKQRGIGFNMRIGLNTGLVVVGRIGDDLTMEYTAMGDTVNLASRMESTAQPGTIQVSENTYRLTEGYFEFKKKKMTQKEYGYECNSGTNQEG